MYSVWCALLLSIVSLKIIQVNALALLVYSLLMALYYSLAHIAAQLIYPVSS